MNDIQKILKLRSFDKMQIRVRNLINKHDEFIDRTLEHQNKVLEEIYLQTEALRKMANNSSKNKEFF